MQNKRGISQAFSPAGTGGELLRRATLFDLFDMSRVLTQSISQLCTADHGGDAAAIARWCANKTPQALRAQMMHEGAEFWLLTRAGQIAAVGALAEIDQTAGTGRVTLNYVDPACRGQGASAALLAGLEARLSEQGIERGLLTSTATARDFYLSRGWRADGPPRQGRWILGHPMAKTLAP